MRCLFLGFEGISVTDSSKYVQELLKYNGEGRVLQEFEEWDPPKLPVTGHDLRSRGIEKGPQVSPTTASVSALRFRSFNVSRGKIENFTAR